MWRRRLTAAGCLAVAIATLWLAYAPLYAHHETHHAYRGNHEQKPGESLMVIVRAIADAIESHHDLWLVIETLALVGFTATLWWSTRQLQRTTESHAEHLEASANAAAASARAALLQAQAAISADIPHVRVTRVILRERGVSNLAGRLQFPSIEVTFKNFGRTPAFLVQESVNLVRAIDLPEIPSYFVKNDYPPGQVIERGDEGEKTRKYDTLSPYPTETINDIIAGKLYLWVYGYLIYQDFMGSFHETGFCARWFGPLGDARDVFGIGFGPPNYTYARDRNEPPQREF